MNDVPTVVPMIACPQCAGGQLNYSGGLCPTCFGRNVVMKPQNLWTPEEGRSVSDQQASRIKASDRGQS